MLYWFQSSLQFLSTPPSPTKSITLKLVKLDIHLTSSSDLAQLDRCHTVLGPSIQCLWLGVRLPLFAEFFCSAFCHDLAGKQWIIENLDYMKQIRPKKWLLILDTTFMVYSTIKCIIYVFCFIFFCSNMIHRMLFVYILLNFLWLPVCKVIKGRFH